MRKQSSVRASLFIVVLTLITICLPRAAWATEPYWLGGAIDVRPYHLSIVVWFNHADRQPVTDALVMLNEHYLQCGGPNSHYSFSTGQIQKYRWKKFTLRIWLKDPQIPFVNGQVPGRLPEISGTGVISNWLTPVFPVHQSGIKVAPNSSTTFTWAFAGAIETTSVYLQRNFGDHLNIFRDKRVSQPSITVPQGMLLPGHYSMMYRVAFPFPLQSKPSLKPGSNIRLEEVTAVSFVVGP